jgi:hypothetical protein
VQPLLPRDRVDALDDAFFSELRDRVHAGSLGPEAAGSVPRDG